MDVTRFIRKDVSTWLPPPAFRNLTETQRSSLIECNINIAIKKIERSGTDFVTLRNLLLQPNAKKNRQCRQEIAGAVLTGEGAGSPSLPELFTGLLPFIQKLKRDP